MSHARTVPILTAALAVIAAAASIAPARAAEIGSLGEAQAMSASGHKPILIEFWMPG